MTLPIVLKDCFKTYTLDQDKAFTPEETVARVKDRLAKARLDVLAETERIDNGRLDIPVFVSRCGADAARIMPTRKQMGKGATPAQAEASAVMEMVERFSFFHFVRHEPFLRAEYGRVADSALPFEHLAASVHHDPADLDRARRAVDGLELDWIEATNLTRGREELIPFNWFYEINAFNGPAAGNTLEEALVQALAEVIERHVSALVCRQELDTPTIDPDSLQNPVARDLVDKFKRRGLELHLKDFSLDTGVATVAALAWDPSTFPRLSEIVFTAGTAADPEKAVIRALTETAQLAGDFNSGANYEASGLPKYTEIRQAGYLTQSARTVSINALPDLSDDNIKVEIERMVRALAEIGLEAYAINVTHPTLQVPAVYVIVPGAHFRERATASSVPFFAAKLLSGNPNPEKVAAGMQKIREHYPDSYYLLFYEGEALIEAGRPQQAARLLFQALHQNPSAEDLAGIMTYLGLALKDMEEYKRAVDILVKSAAVDQDRRDTFNLLGFCYFKLKDHEKAIQAFQRVLELDPGSGLDHANIGTNFRELGRIEEAVWYYKKALELDPSLDWVRENLARIST